ncbi:NUDIX domain-containing protein [Aquicella lusitana]|uniref:ADP-ribose pyrophosphatase n=1 Tax=Aquicella lusitana TaxID=254246 RepID=A0A370G764_9COXI|nr:NUDIX domain-containing protein [Aquicella lusitana]RDI38364.1 ADP-ribose pyrophosphatase [Aquicella lusitana]
MQNNLQSFSQNDYEIIRREVLYQGIFRLARYHVRHRTFNGEWSQPFTREVLERQPAAAILPYDPVLDQVVLIEQFRAGALANPSSPWLIEIVAGVLDADEKPDNVAKREAVEEAGCKILDIYPVCEYFVSPGGSNEYLHLYCGRIDASEAGGVHGLSEENEDIRAFTVSAEEAFILLQEGKINTPPAIISLQWLQLNREWLRQLWQTK